MAKSKKVVSKKAPAPVEAPVEVAPVVASAPAPAPVAPVKGGRKPKAERAAETPAVKWARRLKRWQAKAEAQGVDAKGLMTEALAG